VPDVGWVVQVDAPQDPDAFVHRVGRTARMGRPGAALALLLPAEGAYVEFLRLRRVPPPTRPAARERAALNVGQPAVQGLRCWYAAGPCARQARPARP